MERIIDYNKKNIFRKNEELERKENRMIMLLGIAQNFNVHTGKSFYYDQDSVLV